MPELLLMAALIATYPFAVAAARSPFTTSLKSAPAYLDRSKSILKAWSCETGSTA